MIIGLPDDNLLEWASHRSVLGLPVWLRLSKVAGRGGFSEIGWKIVEIRFIITLAMTTNVEMGSVDTKGVPCAGIVYGLLEFPVCHLGEVSVVHIYQPMAEIADEQLLFFLVHAIQIVLKK